jgi:hypothetical protein
LSNFANFANFVEPRLRNTGLKFWQPDEPFSLWSRQTSLVHNLVIWELTITLAKAKVWRTTPTNWITVTEMNQASRNAPSLMGQAAGSQTLPFALFAQRLFPPSQQQQRSQQQQQQQQQHQPPLINQHQSVSCYLALLQL